MQDGIFIYVPPKTVIEGPLQILNLISSSEYPSLIQPRLQLFLGSCSELQLVHSPLFLAETGHFLNSVADFSIEDNARLKYIQITHRMPSPIWNFEAVRASLKSSSSFQSVHLGHGCAALRSDYRVTLKGENAETDLSGLWKLKQKREAHAHVLIEHQAPHCHSMQLFKNVLADLSRSSFEGKILVRREAQKTEAFQLNNNLLLNEGAMANSKPNLEIFADDVKASHGATVGQLDLEELFYLKARGLSSQAAQQLLIHGFCQEVIDKIGIPSLRQKLTREF
jgi:Fe-S cluster assembly protein SufD